ncbi:acyltransferase family protein [Fulvivirga kasyanovii]|uniref:Acyltransferase n=1 Tax=Fulvivirga kasyanovii TaxID=396812 RepID=A0ABW9RQL9_9BACT|nr:acyltransferase family protein [Fulvivirga kasyanovii]MTI25579.1 acyltransferase [Fulvivirga kasyanovii]
MDKRRYDIDWIRVIAIGLLLIYHIAIAFQPWGVFIGFIQSHEPLEAIWIPMSALNVWRIPLLFFVSGMGVWFALRKRNLKSLLLERTRRIFLPFVFGVLCIVPLHQLLWQDYYHQDISWIPSPAHLWFLGNIFIYVLLLSPWFVYLKEKENPWLKRVLSWLFSSPLGILIIVIPFVLETLLIQPETYEMYAVTWHGFVLGFLCFLTGFCCMLAGDTFWPMVLKWRWPFLGIGILLFLVRLVVFELKGPELLLPVETLFWVFGVFGFGYKHLNKPSDILPALSQAAYPVYIVHMVWLYLGSYLILPLEIAVELKFPAVIVFTALGCYVNYEIIRRLHWLRPLFGLNRAKSMGKEVSVEEVKVVRY